MRLISHRGNLNGTSSYENHPEHIHKALLKGFDVEIDVWFQKENFYLVLPFWVLSLPATYSLFLIVLGS